MGLPLQLTENSQGPSGPTCWTSLEALWPLVVSHLRKGDNDNCSLHLWERCMPHLKYLFHSGRQATLAHQNRTIAIASDFRVDGTKSPEIPQKEGVLDSEIAARNRRSLATFHRTLKSQCSIASLVSEIARFLGSAMGIAIANRKNRCDFGALSRQLNWATPPVLLGFSRGSSGKFRKDPGNALRAFP